MRRAPERDAPLTARQQELVQEARGVVVHVASELSRAYPRQRLEDILTWCEDGAIAAAQSYREGRESAGERRATFPTYAWAWIYGAGRAGIRREGRPIIEELERAIREASNGAGAYAAEQRDAYDAFNDTEEDDARRPREALEGFAAAYVLGLSMGLPAGAPEAELLRAAIRAAVETLKERDHAIVTMYVLERKTFGDIARELPGEPAEVTVRRHFHAAMRRLAKRLEKQRE